MRAWCALAYLFPELHPDAYDDPEGGWPAALLPVAAEAWRRADAGELAEDEVYPADAQWCGLCDRIASPTAEEADRRRELAALYGGTSPGGTPHGGTSHGGPSHGGPLHA